MERFDTIIVGAGSAGCVLAYRLGAATQRRILVLEAGGSDSSIVIAMPAATDVFAVNNPRWDWCLKARPDPTLNHRSEMWPRGKVLGGSSSINGTIYVRGQRQDYDDWAAGGALGWSYDEVLPYFRRSERNGTHTDGFHGANGPLAVEDVRSPHPLTQAFITACVEAGVPFNPDINGERQFGAGPLQATQRRGRRANTASAFLRPAVDRGNVVVRTQAQATRVLFEGRRAVGVEYLQGGRLRQVRADAEVVLSSGSLISPQLLMHSGIGPAASLQAHGINVLHDSPQVGRNLQEHVAAFLSVQVNVPTYNDENSWPRRLLHGAHWLMRGRGPGATPGGQAVAFIKTDPAESRPDVQIHFTPAGYKLHADHLEMFEESSVVMVPNVCRPRSRSWLQLHSGNPLEPLAIESRLMSDADDLRRLVAAGRFLRRLTETPSWARHQVAEILPGTGVQTDDEWEDYVRRAAIPIYHPVGTCRMGSDGAAVVDCSLRVNGVDALRVVDASVMPTLPSGNTNAPTIMVAERAADLILADRKRLQT